MISARAEPLLQVINFDAVNLLPTRGRYTIMTSNIVSCLCWVPRGASKEKPDKVRRDWGGGGGCMRCGTVVFWLAFLTESDNSYAEIKQPLRLYKAVCTQCSMRS